MSAPGKRIPQIGGVSPAFAAVAAFFIAVVLLCMLVLGPKTEALEDAIADTQSENFATKRKLRDLAKEASLNAEDRAAFELLRQAALFEDQSRLRAARLFDALRELHRLSALEYQILPVRRTALARPGEKGVELFTSTISLDMRAVLEGDILNFVQAAIDDLPGKVIIDSLELTRLAVPDGQALRRIRTTGRTELVRGQASLSWHTLDIEEPEAQ